MLKTLKINTVYPQPVENNFEKPKLCGAVTGDEIKPQWKTHAKPES